MRAVCIAGPRRDNTATLGPFWASQLKLHDHGNRRGSPPDVARRGVDTVTAFGVALDQARRNEALLVRLGAGLFQRRNDTRLRRRFVSGVALQYGANPDRFDYNGLAVLLAEAPQLIIAKQPPSPLRCLDRSTNFRLSAPWKLPIGTVSVVLEATFMVWKIDPG